MSDLAWAFCFQETLTNSIKNCFLVHLSFKLYQKLSFIIFNQLYEFSCNLFPTQRSIVLIYFPCNRLSRTKTSGTPSHNPFELKKKSSNLDCRTSLCQFLVQIPSLDYDFLRRDRAIPKTKMPIPKSPSDVGSGTVVMIKLNSLSPAIPPKLTELNVPLTEVRVADMLSGVLPTISTA